MFVMLQEFQEQIVKTKSQFCKKFFWSLKIMDKIVLAVQ
jgi:hypothetical protein